MTLRKNIVLVAGGGTCGILFLIALAFLLRFNATYQTEKKSLASNYKKLERLNRRTPFASKENADLLLENATALQNKLEDLEFILRRDPLPDDAREAADFSAKVQRSIERFRTNAEAEGIQLPDTLEAGFNQYASGGTIPKPQHVARLSRQLYSMNYITDVLVDCKVNYINELIRDNFEQDPEENAPKPDSRRRRRSRKEKPEPPKKNYRLIASKVDPNNLFATEQIKVSFTAHEDTVWKVLDQLAAAPHFMAVTEFSLQTQTEIMSHSLNGSTESDNAKVKEFLSGGILTGAAALPRSERIIAGNELLRVSLVIDVYNFEMINGENG